MHGRSRREAAPRRGTRTSAEEALRLSEARLRATLDTAIDAIITINERGLVQFVNPATTRMFGYTARELIGRNISILMPPPYREEHDSYLARHLETGEKRIIGIGREVRARRKDGTEFPVDLAVSEVEPRKLFTGVIRDISDRKLAEARVRESDRMASIGALAAGLGHDMNNVLLPVRARLNALSAAADAGSIPAAERRHVEEIRKSVAYLHQLADGLHFLAMDPDTVSGAGSSTDVRRWWSQAGPLISKAVPRDVRVIASFPKGLPEVAVAGHGLTQAILNLVVNAGDAIPAGRKHRRGVVRVWARPDAAASADASVTLGVTDDGAGMSEEVKRRAFELFFTTKPRGMGTGLGLALVRRVADNAGGSVKIESQVGKGTTVLLTLPAARPPAAADRPVAVVSLSDGRAASMAIHLLSAAGADARAAVSPGDADIWVMDAAPDSIRRAFAWRAQHPRGRLVLFGRPATAALRRWQSLHPVTIFDPNDFEAMRAALARALAGD